MEDTVQQPELAQRLNHTMETGELAVPEMIPVARQMAAEGIVLLKNENHILPIRKEQKVSVFGRTAVDYFTVGYGSGGDVIPPYKASLMDGLRNSGVQLNEILAAAYEKWCCQTENIPNQGTWGDWPMSYPEMPLSEKCVRNAAASSDMALIVIGRAAGEDRENLLEKGSYYLTDQEQNMLNLVTSAFTKVCVILDCGNIIDMSWISRYGDRVSAIVYAWQGGMESGYALSDMLTGVVNPSGRLTDTIAKAYELYPSAQHFGGEEFNCYGEDIYVGYRYFETFRPEDVLYPFGYGLSYTNFDLKIACKHNDSDVVLNVDVTNTGNLSGKQVVQAYLCPPCGKLGNPSRVLAAFKKTDTLAPGQTQSIRMKIDLRDFASFDDSGVTGCKSCFVLEAGKYSIAVGENIRDAKEAMCFQKAELEVVRKAGEILTVPTNQQFRRIVNHDGELVFEECPISQKNLKSQILRELPEAFACETSSIHFSDVVSGKHSAEAFVAQLSIQELCDLTRGYGPMDCPYGIEGNAGGFGGVTKELRARGLPAIITTDGPSGIRIQRTVGLLPCGTALASTFNLEGIEQLYTLVSQEMAHWGTHILLAPGMNIHRNPLCGRNFEYFSEDPFLSGKMAAAVIRGIQSTGRSACPKHFACNNQETNRNHNDSRVTERALREIYLKGFEIAVKEADPHAIMSSYNKINGVWGHYHYELATQILRQEWGFQGVVLTDWWMQPDVSREFPNIRDDAYRVRAQVDVLMPGDLANSQQLDPGALLASREDPNGVTLAEVQRCALNVVRFILKLEKNIRKL